MERRVRRLTADDAEVYRAIRLEALRNHPEAFAASLEYEEGLPLEEFADRLRQNDIFGGFLDGELVGTAAFAALTSSKMSHKGILWGMYLRDAARGSGLGQSLVERVIDQAKGRVELLTLTVVATNARAVRFYEKLGFQSYGTEPKALKVDGVYYDEVLMVHRLED